MDPTLEISTFDGGLELYKLPRTWKRDLSVRISLSDSGQAIQVVEFPMDQDHMAITGLNGDGPLKIDVVPNDLLRRLRRGTTKFVFQAKPSPFRVVISGSGRCGTTTLAEYLDGMSFTDGEDAVARHETLYEYLMPWILDGSQESISRFMVGQLHNIESAPYFAHVPQLVVAETVVHLVRDGRRVCQSGLNRDWYESTTLWNRIKPDFEGTVFEKVCHFWRYTNEQVETISDVFVRLEDIAEKEDVRLELLSQLGLKSNGQEFPHSNKGKAPSGFDSWTDEMRNTFTEICGEMMDRYYPGWQDSW